ncbi:MAG: glycosyltransferase family 4 protein [Candidatus Moranbacteria bacterium]|nr:glycosyltransferase family 4 protein [Candidatus Moranbacteria bacterium]
MSHKTVLLATRPLVPPWDEASKNFAYFLGREVRNYSLTLLTAKELLSGLPESVHQEPIFKSGHFDLGAKVSLFSYLRQSRQSFDITHYLFTPTKQNTSLIKWCAKPQGKTVQTVATLREDLYSKQELQSLLFADRLVVYTELTKQKLERLGFTNVTRIYPGIDLNRYQPQAKDPGILARYHLTLDDFLVIYPGEYTRLGATDMLLTAFTTYFTEHPESDIKFLFACRVKHKADHVKREELRQAVKQSGLTDKILFEENTTPDMAALYNTADVVIFPVENLKGKFDVPLVIIEAYACGKSVILSDLPQFSEFTNSDICVTIPKDSGEKLIESLAYIKQNRNIMAHLGENARRFAVDHFDLKNTAKQYEEIYASL